MNALTWLKEYAARSQTADALEDVKKRAYLDTSKIFGTLIEQDQRSQEMAATFAGRNSLEEIQQSGLTDRARMDSRDKALAAAAALVKDQAAGTERDINNLQGLKDPAAVRAFAAARGVDPNLSEPIASNAEFVNKSAAEPVDHEEVSILTTLRGADTPQAVKAAIELVPEGLKNKPSVTTAIAVALHDAASKDLERKSVQAARQALIDKRGNVSGKPFDVGRLAAHVQQQPTVLVCLERDASRCHRSRLAEAIARLVSLPVTHL